ncbi:hypothetical protein GCM10009721_28180 [Terrabacter tumescens]|uniref:Uncharacterized protein n=1 Tax=Terrabacter tumescens TaxID=60443 RepID=A0ABQ2I4Q6_9MICO|nr:hypothetical protein GCM10009721_28180 [Terrabacter tumescens]
MSKSGKTPRMRRAAREHAASLGPILNVKPSRGYRAADDSPRAGAHQAYVTPTGSVFHPVWCRTVGERWDMNPNSIHVVDRSTVGRRTVCRTCDTDGPIAD